MITALVSLSDLTIGDFIVIAMIVVVLGAPALIVIPINLYLSRRRKKPPPLPPSAGK
jgi:hypothetical protein